MRVRSLALLVSLLCVLGINLSYETQPFFEWYRYNDFAHFYTTSVLLREGGPVYGIPIDGAIQKLGFLNVPPIPQATNPPALLILFLPFTFLPPELAFYVWGVLQIVMLVVAVVILLRMLNRGFLEAAFVLLGVCVSNAFLAHVQYSQVQSLLLGGLVIAFAMSTSKKPIFGTVAVTLYGVVTGIKLFTWPVLFLAYSYKGRQGVFYFLVGVLLVNVPVLLFTDATIFLDFVRYALPSIHEAAFEHSSNISLPHAIIWTSTKIFRSVDRYALQQFISVGLTIASFVGIAWYTTCKAKKRTSWQMFSALLLASVIVAPTVWPHYLLFGLPAFVYLWAHCYSRKHRYALCLLAFILLLANGRNPMESLMLQAFQVWSSVLVLLALLYAVCLEKPGKYGDDKELKKHSI